MSLIKKTLRILGIILCTIVEHALSDEHTPQVLTFLSLVDVGLGLGQHVHAKMLLGTCQIIIGIPHVAVVLVFTLLTFIFCQIVEEFFPLFRNVLHAFPTLLLVESVAIIRIDVVKRRRIDVAYADELQALLVTVDGFVEIAHVWRTWIFPWHTPLTIHSHT